MDDEDLDENGVTALRIFNKAMIETSTYIKEHQEVLSGLNKTTEMIRRHKLKQLLDFANSAIEEFALHSRNNLSWIQSINTCSR